MVVLTNDGPFWTITPRINRGQNTIENKMTFIMVCQGFRMPAIAGFWPFLFLENLISKIGPGQLSERKKWHCEIRFFLPIQ
jgi:hypothetical protein